MSKLIFVGDVHLKGSNPISRKDNYAEVILGKISYIRDYALSIGCSNIFFLGDIFDTVNTSLQYFSHCLNLFKQISDSGINQYTIVGNHDIRYDSLDTLPVTPLGILVKSGALKILDNEVFDDVVVAGCHYPDTPKQNCREEYSILLLHRFFDSGFNEEPITKEDVINLGYDSYILGHDHRPYSTINIETEYGLCKKVFRIGSLARNSSEQYNKLRKPRILVFDTVSKNYNYVEIPSEAGEDIFFEKEVESQASMSDLVEYLKSSYHTADESIRTYVDRVDMPDDVRELVQSYLTLLGA